MNKFLSLAARLVFATYCAKLASSFLYVDNASTAHAAFVGAFALYVLDLTYRYESAR